MAGARKQWTSNEDECMLRIIDEHGTRNWTTVAEALTAETGSSRSGKQCRTRFINHLDPDINRDPWTLYFQEEEDTILYEAHAEHGNKWAKISSLLPGRTDNQVKNHYYSTMRRTVRRIHREVSRPAGGGGAGPSGDGDTPPAARMEQVISQLSDADAANFKACYGVLQQSLSGQASASSILNSDLPKCVTSAITNPPARSKRRRQAPPPQTAPAAVAVSPPPVTLPMPSFVQFGNQQHSLPPIGVPLPPLGGPLPPLSSVGFHHSPMHVVWGGYQAAHAMPHTSVAPTAVVGPDGRLHLLPAASSGSQQTNTSSARSLQAPGVHSYTPAFASHQAPSVVLPAASAPLHTASSAALNAAGGAAAAGGERKRGKKRKLATMQIATDADLDPNKLANLIPQHTPGGSLLPLRKRAHTQLLLGLLSHRSQPTEQSRLASAAQAGRYTVHHGSAFSSSDSGDEDNDSDEEQGCAAGAGAGGGQQADAGATGAASVSMHGKYTAVDRFSNAMVQLQRTPAGALIQFVPQPLPSATGTHQMQLPGTPLDAVAQGLMHNANTLFSSQNALSLAQLGLTPRGGNAEWDDVAAHATDDKKRPSGKFFPEHASGVHQADSSVHSSGGTGGPHSAPVAPLASPLTDSVFEVKSGLPSASSSMAQAGIPPSHHVSQAAPQQLEIDETAVREFFALPQHLRTPTGLGALAAASSANGPGGYILRGSVTPRLAAESAVGSAAGDGAHPSSSSGSDRNTVVTRISSKSEELLAGTAAMLGSHPKLRALMSGRLQMLQTQDANATGDAPTAQQDDHRDLLPSSTRTQQDVQQRSAGLARLLVSPGAFQGHMTPRLLTNTTGASGMFFAGTPHTGHAEHHSSSTHVREGAAQERNEQQRASVMFDFS